MVKWAVLFMVAGCAHVPCNAQAELDIDRACLREIVEACRGYSYDDCPHREAIQERCRARRIEAAECRS